MHIPDKITSLHFVIVYVTEPSALVSRPVYAVYVGMQCVKMCLAFVTITCVLKWLIKKKKNLH